MGEMQGTRARARLESLLRPRRNKRAEAQKRSESVLLTGLGKPARGDPHPQRPLRGSSGGAGGAGASEGGGMGTAGAGSRPGAWPQADPEDKGAGAALPRRGHPVPGR